MRWGPSLSLGGTMPETTAGGIQYPIAGDFIKQDSIEAKLANDMRDLAQTADNAIQVAAEAAEWPARDLASGEDMRLLSAGLYGVPTYSLSQSLAPALPVAAFGAGSLEVLEPSASYKILRWTTTG